MRARSVLRRRATDGGPLGLAADEAEAGGVADEDVDADVVGLEVLALLLLPLLELPLPPAGAAWTDGPD